MTCPYCGAEDCFTTIDSRKRTFGIKRRKKCAECGYLFATIEIWEITEEAIKSLNKTQRLIDARVNKKKG